MVNAEEIRDRIRDLFDRQISLRDFQVWFASSTCDAYRSDDLVARDLASKIDLSLSEYSGGYLSRDLLLEDLATFAGLGLTTPIRPFEQEPLVVAVSSFFAMSDRMVVETVQAKPQVASKSKPIVPEEPFRIPPSSERITGARTPHRARELNLLNLQLA